jgi:hypothetical protein
LATELIICPLCGIEIYRHFRTSVMTRVSVSSQIDQTTKRNVFAELQRVALEEQAQELRAAEQACFSHYETQHRRRLRLWERFGWSWLLGWPTRKSTFLWPDQQVFSPLKFIVKKKSR